MAAVAPVITSSLKSGRKEVKGEGTMPLAKIAFTRKQNAFLESLQLRYLYISLETQDWVLWLSLAAFQTLYWRQVREEGVENWYFVS